MRRVVVTGLGVVSPLGVGAARSFENLLNGKSGNESIQNFDVSDMPCRVAGQVPRGEREG